ncbi:recombinase family protein [Bacillus salacetis]|uniref:recombinase family protein n=1 Tax=Bacillus salacetis TaxID=2315464 RepID=UPI003BA2009E
MYGYVVIDGTLHLRTDQTPEVVQWIYEEYISGRGFDSIARELYVKNIPTPSMIANRKNCGPRWHGTSVRFILENPHYTGSLVQQRETTLSVTNKTRIKNPKDKMIIVPNTHKSLVSEVTFQLVQDLIKNRSKKRNPSNKHLFSNIITCYDCGTSMHFKSNRKGYICGAYVKYTKKACSHHAIKEENLIRHILDDLDKCRKKVLISGTSEKLHEINRREKIRLSNRVTTLQSKIESVQAKKSKLLTLLMDETINKSEYQVAVSSYDKEISSIKSEETQLQYILKRKDNEEEINKLRELLDEVSCRTDITNTSINKLIKHIKIKRNGTPLIEYRFQTLNYLEDL